MPFKLNLLIVSRTKILEIFSISSKSKFVWLCKVREDVRYKLLLSYTFKIGIAF